MSAGSQNVFANLQSKTVFAGLLGWSWKDVSFPATDFKIELRQDLAIHRFANLDGAECEPTGRHPLQFTARIPFLNNITSAPSEHWPRGDLYPNQFRKFFAACADRSKGVLIHPEFAAVMCVLEHCSVDWKASTRDGVYVDATWIETFDADGGVSPNITGAGQISTATQSGIDLDTLLPQLPKPTFPSLPKDPGTFAEFARSLQSVADQVSLLQYSTAGQIASVLYRVNNIMRAVGQATHTGPDAANSVQAWPIRDAADRYLYAVGQIQNKLLGTNKRVGLYVPKDNTSLPMLAQTIPAPVGDLMNLNPSLLTQLVVPARTKVRYYIDTPKLGLPSPSGEGSV